MRLATLLSEVYPEIGLDSSPGSAMTTLITSYANRVHKELLSDPVFKKHRRRTLPFTAISGVAQCALPQAAVAIYGIVDRLNQNPLTPVDISWIRRQDPGQTQTSATPEAFAIVGFQQAAFRQPTAASQLYVKCSAAGVVGVSSRLIKAGDGYSTTATATTAGTTAQTLGSTDTISIEEFFSADVLAVEVQLYIGNPATTGVLAAVIGREQRAKYTVIELFPVPTSAYTLYADVRLEIPTITDTSQEFLLPDEFSSAMIHGVRYYYFQKRKEWEAAKAAFADQERAINKMRYDTHKPDTSGPDIRQGSQLGGWYPPGT